jgi:hypothetical protein
MPQKLLTAFFLCSILILPQLSLAQPAAPNSTVPDSFYNTPPTIDPTEAVITKGGFVPCSGVGCSACDFVVMANTITKWLIGISFIFFAVLCVIAGTKMITSGGNPSALTDAKKSLTNAFIGLIIIMAAWLAVDTLLRGLLKGNNGQIEGYGPWSQVQCAKQAQSSTQNLGFEETAINYHVPAGAEDMANAPPGSGSGTARCSPITDTANVCSPGNLTAYFGSRASEASQICNRESGGAAVMSGSDLCCGADGNCAGALSFSGGYFQVNFLDNARMVPGCSASGWYNSNGGSTPKGNCVRRNARGVCTGWSCEITNTAMYNTCRAGAVNPSTNLSIARTLYNGRGGHFQDWSWSQRICGVAP